MHDVFFVLDSFRPVTSCTFTKGSGGGGEGGGGRRREEQGGVW